MSASDLTSKQKLQWLGLSEAVQSLSNVQTEIDLLKSNLNDYQEFQDHLEFGYDFTGDGTKTSIDDFSTFDAYLQDIGFTADEADQFIEKIKQNFTDQDSDGTVFDEFKNYVINESDEFSTLATAFGSSTQITGNSSTDDGVAASGIKFHESGGVTRNGVSVPPGTTEVYGREIHFSQSAPPSNSGPGSGSGGISYENISSDPVAPLVGEVVTISADVTNNFSTEAQLATDFKEDGVMLNDKSVEIGASETVTVEFLVSKNSTESHDYTIGKSDSVTVYWIPQNIGPYGGP